MCYYKFDWWIILRYGICSKNVLTHYGHRTYALKWLRARDFFQKTSWDSLMPCPGHILAMSNALKCVPIFSSRQTSPLPAKFLTINSIVVGLNNDLHFRLGICIQNNIIVEDSHNYFNGYDTCIIQILAHMLRTAYIPPSTNHPTPINKVMIGNKFIYLLILLFPELSLN